MMVFVGICYALSIEDNGYAWNSENYEERIAVCKVLANTIGKDYLWWFSAFNSFYDTTEQGILNINIKGAASLLPFFEGDN